MSEPSFQRSNSWPLIAFFSIAVLFVLVVVMRSPTSNSINADGARELRVYCAAGVRLAVEEAARQFEKELGVRVVLEYVIAEFWPIGSRLIVRVAYLLPTCTYPLIFIH